MATEEEVREGINDKETQVSAPPVDNACVICMNAMDSEPLHIKKANIEGQRWWDVDAVNDQGEDMEVLDRDSSYMVCTKWAGIIYFHNDGQEVTTNEENILFESDLREKGFPQGYIVYLMALHEKYPKWEFEPVFTNVDYQKFLKYQIENQTKCADNEAYLKYCSNIRFLGEDASKYYVATGDAFRYFSHPYSMLLTGDNIENALQFLNGNQKLPPDFSEILVPSILRNSKAELVEFIKNSDESVNPVFLASICAAENGPVGEIYNKKIVYNPFNIGAVSGKASALEYAYKNQWYTLEKCMEESKEFIQSYIDRGQNTLYALDWDYVSFGNNDSLKQYATLVNDGEDKALNMRKRGDKKFDLNYELKFSIPIYDNIPTYNNEAFKAFPDPNK